MENRLIESGATRLSKMGSSNDPALSLASANLRYHSASEDHYFPIQRVSMCTIGRSTTNNISLDDRLLSRDHAMIRCSSSGMCEITDLGSSNGTSVNGALISAAVTLRDGDVIQVGQHAMTFIQNNQAAGLIIDADADRAVDVFPPNSLITALSLNIRGYVNLSQILGAEQLDLLMADIAAIAGEVFTRRHSWKHQHQGSAVHAVWAHHDDWLLARDLLNIFDAIAEIQLGVRPLQKRYHLLRPIAFGCGVSTGHAMLADVAEAAETDFDALCSVVRQAHQLEIATHTTGCDILMNESGLTLLAPPLENGNLPALCSVSAKNMPEMLRAYALRFDQLSGLSVVISRSSAKSVSGR
ncbi:MAG: FHA domain-containing protein [Pseudomonadota bacterium]